MISIKQLLLVFLFLLLSTQVIFAGRYYDAKTGRWTSVDPLAHKLPGHDPYSYTLNNPLRYIDPDGKFPWDIVDIAAFGWSLKDFVNEPSWENAGWLALDAAGLLPGVPAAGSIRHGSDILLHSDDIGGMFKGLGKSDDILKNSDNVWDGLKDGQKLSTNDALSKAEEYLGEGYKEVADGVYRSADGKRQVRMTPNDLNDKRGPHLNFERGETKINHKGKESFKPYTENGNKHIYIEE